MDEKTYISVTLCSTILGLLAGILAVVTVLAKRRRLDLWSRYMGYSSPGWLLTMAAAHFFGWYGLLAAIPVYFLIVLAFTLDTRKKIPR
ncbi:MAG TPA: hypothetical protein VL527_14910 [Dongiaceae bacterium]|jgi:hypothetical protein|nr:hypothetical protein [Dongiaceae bacterium]